MADIKWIKLTINIFEDEKIRLIDAMPERDTIHYVWLRLLVQAGKTNSDGFIFLSENIPYTDEMLSTLFCRPLTSIRLALKTLEDFGMIEIDEDNFIRISNWDKHQNIEGMDRVRAQNRKRVQGHREKKKQIEAAAEQREETSIEIEENQCAITQNLCNVTEGKSNVTVMQQNKRETKNKKEIKNENKKERDYRETPIPNVIGVSDSHKRQAFGSLLKETPTPDVVGVSDSHQITDLGSLLKSEPVRYSVSQSKDSITEQDKNLEDINTKCIELIKYAETITGIPNVLNLGALKLAIGVHGHQYVKMAIDIALKADKPNMTYIDGILKNWRREGYPTDREVKKNVNRSYGKNSSPDKNEFTGFKPKKPRGLTDEQRKIAEEALI